MKETIRMITIKKLTPAIHQDMLAYIQHLVKTHPTMTTEQLNQWLVDYTKMMNYEIEEA